MPTPDFSTFPTWSSGYLSTQGMFLPYMMGVFTTKPRTTADSVVERSERIKNARRNNFYHRTGVRLNPDVTQSTQEEYMPSEERDTPNYKSINLNIYDKNWFFDLKNTVRKNTGMSYKDADYLLKSQQEDIGGPEWEERQKEVDHSNGHVRTQEEIKKEGPAFDKNGAPTRNIDLKLNWDNVVVDLLKYSNPVTGTYFLTKDQYENGKEYERSIMEGDEFGMNWYAGWGVLGATGLGSYAKQLNRFFSPAALYLKNKALNSSIYRNLRYPMRDAETGKRIWYTTNLIPSYNTNLPATSFNYGGTKMSQVVSLPLSALYRLPYYPDSHLQGEDTVRMFKEYGGEAWPEGSINGLQLMAYVPEARERYGLVGNANITDEEIARALYKHSKELGGNTAAVNEQGEPQLLFRGDTNNYTELKERTTPETLAGMRGTMDNSLGTLFLGEYPGMYPERFDAIGVSRYLHGTYYNPVLGEWMHRESGTGKLKSSTDQGYRMFWYPEGGWKNKPMGFVKDKSTKESPNWLNLFISRTPAMRDATHEISVLNDDRLLSLFDGMRYLGKNYYLDKNDWGMVNKNTGEFLGEITDGNALESREATADHYAELLRLSKENKEGLLKSERGNEHRDEHKMYTYFALPNWNIMGAKHILPYDLRIPRNWNSKNIFKSLIGTGVATSAINNNE